MIKVSVLFETETNKAQSTISTAKLFGSDHSRGGPCHLFGARDREHALFLEALHLFQHLVRFV
jgi:hypothetical protein